MYVLEIFFVPLHPNFGLSRKKTGGPAVERGLHAQELLRTSQVQASQWMICNVFTIS